MANLNQSHSAIILYNNFLLIFRLIFDVILFYIVKNIFMLDVILFCNKHF
jgi:hypothetical protein